MRFALDGHRAHARYGERDEQAYHWKRPVQFYPLFQSSVSRVPLVSRLLPDLAQALNVGV